MRMLVGRRLLLLDSCSLCFFFFLMLFLFLFLFAATEVGAFLPNSRNGILRHSSSAFATSTGDTDEYTDAFDLFCHMRTGLPPQNTATTSDDDNSIVYWAGSGTLYQAYSGEILANFAGVDVARGLRVDNATCRQLSRKAFWFTDPTTGQVMREFRGQKVDPILYEAQVFEFRRDTSNPDRILPSVVSSTRQVPVQPITCTRMYDSNDSSQQASPSVTLFQAPVFVDIPLPKSDKRYQAWEFYDYTITHPHDLEDPSPTVVWSRQGSTVPFDTQQRAVLRLIGQRYTQLDQLPDYLLERLETDFPLYCQPPRDMDEVQASLKNQQMSGS